MHSAHNNITYLIKMSKYVDYVAVFIILMLFTLLQH